ncbi:MAG: hypothetical protein GXO92_03160 [FCB group bacterium]|nr:hypothetical protein [FCB group bacterium]
MNLNKSKSIAIILTGLLAQSCYTQLAVTQRVEPQPTMVYQEETTTSDDTLYPASEEAPSLVYEYNYWFVNPPTFGYGYDPYFGNIDYYFNVSLGWGDPYWYSPYYRPYRWRYYYSSWGWYDPYWYDPYGNYWAYDYYPGYYGYSYGGHYWSGDYYDDSYPQKKRDWDRRGADLTDTPIVRPGNLGASELLATNSGEVEYLLQNRNQQGTEPRSIERNEPIFQKPTNRKVEREIKKVKYTKIKKKKKRSKHSHGTAYTSMEQVITKSVTRSTGTRSRRQNSDANSRAQVRNNTVKNDRPSYNYRPSRNTSVSRSHEIRRSSGSRSSGESRARGSGKSNSGRKRNN